MSPTWLASTPADLAVGNRLRVSVQRAAEVVTLWDKQPKGPTTIWRSVL